ncbi:hypothetical protein IP92_03008 [Pseudoduganella flava]|uniref:Uncharacterized protein n=1 Tax=Pseudoduganella flava TaxID=871742 RepID=A0A562PQG8_9BURK|nr:hypothetical protein [Pseudoduganella flava]QGZ37825.1 hypothetical protein GO485_01335 [Pseudoduganella flava]TWI46649.1 hypothetical protein IP92_03008 [Pseudoduganella flava]
MYKPIPQSAAPGCQNAVPCRPAEAPSQSAPQPVPSYSSTLKRIFANLVWLR